MKESFFLAFVFGMSALSLMSATQIMADQQAQCLKHSDNKSAVWVLLSTNEISEQDFAQIVSSTKNIAGVAPKITNDLRTYVHDFFKEAHHVARSKAIRSQQRKAIKTHSLQTPEVTSTFILVTYFLDGTKTFQLASKDTVWDYNQILVKIDCSIQTTHSVGPFWRKKTVVPLASDLLRTILNDSAVHLPLKNAIERLADLSMILGINRNPPMPKRTPIPTPKSKPIDQHLG